MILKNKQGSVLVEFAIFFPILVFIIFAVQDLSVYMCESSKIEKIVTNAVIYPVKIKSIIDFENSPKIDSYDEDNGKNMLQAIFNASKLIFYSHFINMKDVNLENIAVCWTLIKAENNNGNILLTLPWRVFVKLTDDTIQNNKIQFTKDNIFIKKNIKYSANNELFKNYVSKIKYNDLYQIKEKIPGGEGYLLVLEIFDQNTDNKNFYLSSVFAKKFFTFHKIAYKNIDNDIISPMISDDITGILDAQ